MYNQNILNMTDLVKNYLLSLNTELTTVVDMTVGNGHDTLFLVENYQKVIGFDIQKIAIEKTKKLTSAYQNLTLYCCDHNLVDQIVTKADLFIFNLGWLPHSDKTLFTNQDSTIKTLNKVVSLLNKNGLIIITCYNGDISQKNESQAILKWANLQKNLVTLQFKMPFKETAPFTLIIGRNDL